jgi:hypothetical protein
MPLTFRHAPILLKIALVLAFKLKQGPVESALSKGVGAAYLPLGFTFLLWFLLTLPSLCVETRNNTASLCYVVYGNVLFTIYVAGLTLSIVLQPEATVFLAASAAVHFAWFCSEVHDSALHGKNVMQSCMYGTICVWMYYCVYALPSCLNVPDFHFLMFMWVPEMINVVLNFFVTRFLAMVLVRTTCWRLVGDKDD